MALDVVVTGGRCVSVSSISGAAPDALPDGPARQFLRPGDVTMSPVDDGVPARLETVLWASGGMRAEVTVDGVPHRIEVNLPDPERHRVGESLGLRFHCLRVFA